MIKGLHKELVFMALVFIPSYFYWRSVDVDPQAVEAVKNSDFMMKGALLVVFGGSFMLYKVLKDRKYPFSGKVDFSRDGNPILYWVSTGFLALAVLESGFKSLQAYITLN